MAGCCSPFFENNLDMILAEKEMGKWVY